MGANWGPPVVSRSPSHTFPYQLGCLALASNLELTSRMPLRAISHQVFLERANTRYSSRASSSARRCPPCPGPCSAEPVQLSLLRPLRRPSLLSYSCLAVAREPEQWHRSPTQKQLHQRPVDVLGSRSGRRAGRFTQVFGTRFDLGGAFQLHFLPPPMVRQRSVEVIEARFGDNRAPRGSPGHNSWVVAPLLL